MILTKLYLAFALGAGNNIKEFFFHIFSRMMLLIGRAGSSGLPDSVLPELLKQRNVVTTDLMMRYFSSSVKLALECLPVI
ncbi:hypothetical protein KKHLCK_00310 [Candidatus Electrothrix laxa]